MRNAEYSATSGSSLSVKGKLTGNTYIYIYTSQYNIRHEGTTEHHQVLPPPSQVKSQVIKVKLI